MGDGRMETRPGPSLPPYQQGEVPEAAWPVQHRDGVDGGVGERGSECMWDGVQVTPHLLGQKSVRPTFTSVNQGNRRGSKAHDTKRHPPLSSVCRCSRGLGS